MSMRLIGCLVVALVASLGLQATAHAGPSTLRTGVGGPEFLDPDQSLRNEWLQRANTTHSDFIRIDAIWAALAPSPPNDPTNPNDPAYDFSRLDGAVSSAVSHGIEPLLNVSGAPRWASAGNCPGRIQYTACKPSPAAFGALGEAIARRYSGSFAALPRVRFFQAWNEPNIDDHLSPQWQGKKAVSPERYRKMLNAFSDSVHGVDRDNFVVSAGTAPFGEPRGKPRMRPLVFWRGVFCLNQKLRRTCKAEARFDALAHHAINPTSAPQKSAFHRDDAAIPDLDRVQRVLRAAERRGSAPGGRHPLWMTEMWWETNPPDGFIGIGLRRQANYIARTMYEVWRDGAAVAINLQIRDQEYQPSRPESTIQGGLYFRNGKIKPGAEAFAFPFLAVGRSRDKTKTWGVAPHAGLLELQRRAAGGWKTVARRSVKEKSAFKIAVKVPRRSKLRAKVGSSRSRIAGR